ncbi:hypothetical protein CHS0354_006525, partial [Potamilus streckersoni]
SIEPVDLPTAPEEKRSVEASCPDKTELHSGKICETNKPNTTSRQSGWKRREGNSDMLIKKISLSQQIPYANNYDKCVNGELLFPVK